MIKRIGTAAREELERFFATRVFLDLHVRVKADWREDDRVLHESASAARARDRDKRSDEAREGLPLDAIEAAIGDSAIVQ